jgi:hypothetical protein
MGRSGGRSAREFGERLELLELLLARVAER